MIDVTVVITRDTATPAIIALRGALESANLLPVFGRSVANAVRTNFDELEASRPNKLGGQRTHYYSGARKATHFTVEGDTATVGVAQVGIRFRYYGGTITAGVNASATTGKPTKYLTIPATAEAYGHRAADFDDLVVLWGRSGPYALGRVEQKTVAIADSFGAKTVSTEVLFWLVQKVEGQADHSMLPSPEVMGDAVRSDFNKYIRAVWRTRSAQSPEGGE